MAETIDGGGSSTKKVKQYYKISIDRTNLGRATFKGPIKKISLKARSSIDSGLIPIIPPTDAENNALNNVSIQIKLSMKRYNPNNVLIGSYSGGSYKKNLVKTVGIGDAVSPTSSYPLDIAAGGNHLKMDNEGALSFGKIILDSTTDINNFTLANNELGLFIINFSTSDDPAATQYTAILSRVGRNTLDDMGGPLIPPIGGIGGGSSEYNYSTFATDSGGYRLECTGDGEFIIYNSNGGPQPVCYLKKIIKIMSY